MANEATPVEGPYEVHDFTVAEATTIPKYTLCTLTDPRTAIASSADGAAFAGIAQTEFEGGKNKTEFGLSTKGTYVLTSVPTIGAEGAIDVGDTVVVSGVNLIRAAVAADLLTGAVVGKAKEAIAAGTTGEVTLGAFA